MLKKLVNEPALVTGAVLAIIGVCSAFGLGLTDGQSDAIVAAVGAVLSLIGSVVIRQQVTPARLVAAKYGNAMGGAGAVTTRKPGSDADVYGPGVEVNRVEAEPDGWDPAEHPRDARGRFIDDGD